jgi:Uncharacterized protein conserved in bacteria (DUF2252)
VAEAAVQACIEAYCTRMHRYASLPELDIWYDGIHADSLIGYFEPADRGRVSVHIEKKRRHRTSRGALAKLTTMAQGRPRITEDPPIRVTLDDQEQADIAGHLLAEYRLSLQEDRRALFDRFTLVDVVRQVVGVGSVGMRVYLVLLEGRSGADPLFLQLKQAGPSVYESSPPAGEDGSHGFRVIQGKRLIQSATDIFVGWGSLALLCCLLVIHFDSRVDRAIIQVVHPPPRSITWLVTVVYQAGSFGVIAVLVIAALLARRWVIARDIGLTAAIAAAISGLLVVGLGRSGGRSPGVTIAGYALSFPVLQIALFAAIATAALPYLGRSLQRIIEIWSSAGARRRWSGWCSAHRSACRPAPTCACCWPISASVPMASTQWPGRCGGSRNIRPPRPAPAEQPAAWTYRSTAGTRPMRGC